MDYVLVPLTDERVKAVNNCNEDNCNPECPCFMNDDCLNNHHKLSEITTKMQKVIDEYVSLGYVKITGDYYPNIDRMQVMQYAKAIVEESCK